jgi:hypothetical protein
MLYSSCYIRNETSGNATHKFESYGFCPMCHLWSWRNLILFYTHAGVRGNKRADRLAGTAVISDGRAMDHADVSHALRKAGRVEDSL